MTKTSLQHFFEHNSDDVQQDNDFHDFAFPDERVLMQLRHDHNAVHSEKGQKKDLNQHTHKTAIVVLIFSLSL